MSCPTATTSSGPSATFGIFCLVASGTYFVNDTLDAASDQHHPTKRLRPVAAGELPPAAGRPRWASAQAAAVGLAWWLAGWQLALVIALYAGLSTVYSLRLKHEPVIDLACVSSGFVLRAIAGGVATGVPLSDWFLIVASFGSLLVVAGKRSAEHADLGENGAAHRPALSAYPAAFLRSVRLIAASVTLTAYCLWAFERARRSGRPPPASALVRAVDRAGRAGRAPPRAALRIAATVTPPRSWRSATSILQVLGLVWIVLFAVGVYV